MRYALVTILILLSSCGFRPLYDLTDNTNLISDLSAITPSTSQKGKESQLMINLLEEELNYNGATSPSKYYLNFTYEIEIEPSLVQNNSQITRYTTLVKFYYSLVEIENNREVAKGRIVLTSAYDNVSGSYYATIVAKNNSIKNVFREISKEVRRRLIIGLQKP